jgi:hypothetical protein
MNNLSKLKGIDENSPFTKLGVTHDMIKSEGEANKAKLNEAKEKNDNNPRGNTCFLSEAHRGQEK